MEQDTANNERTGLIMPGYINHKQKERIHCIANTFRCTPNRLEYHALHDTSEKRWHL